ncbi:MAG TPA: CoA pyrophosphatase [Stellaceae bacterium]|nr:CoA pyrophosphatase [Stellaceae bacterium]
MQSRFAGLDVGRRGFGTERDGWLPAGVRGDHSLMPGGEAPAVRLTLAAVLVPLVKRETELTVLLTQRTAHLNDHAGQVAFPGGRIEKSDRDPIHAALRETDEEVGVPADYVEVIGRLDTYITGTGYEITPVVGLVRAPYPMRPDPDEVADVFEVPLSFILDPRNHERHSREVKGRVRSFYVLPYPGRYIWGATAGMLVNLAEVLGGR